ncbi:MAG: hypothetical protein OJJ21_11815 [Ferrovibrio sp.]|uniref:TnsA endonuclease N-terminal domain-containing protein n=1 Tax=Ferrovibrio sp. TaxID=1917215 RepID=UPI00261BB9EF|nr:TnsA endonuclease N-terminal domain-containing protein [Ferrovibrio sp.]MCW0234275.1 hypothetical protein [Ferrovibrio sp.]
MLHWESMIERDFMIQLETDPLVLRFREQPGTFALEVNGETRRYTPDIYAEEAAGPCVYEVKPDDDLEDNEDLFRAAADFFECHGYRFVVAKQSAIQKQPQLRNKEILLRYAAHPIAPQTATAARAILLATGGCPFGQLVDALKMYGGTRGTIYGLMYRGLISADFEHKDLTDSTMVRWL